MKAVSRLVISTALLVLMAGAAGAGALEELEREQQELFERVQPSVVLISDGTSMGSGFFVSRDGLVLTNAHVVSRADELDVVLPDGTKLRGKVIERAAKGIDLALVQVPKENTPPLVFASGNLRIGAWVGAIGHGRGGIWAFNTGMVSNIYPHGEERPVFQTQIPLNPGNSGGPVFDKEGRVIGIVTAGITESNSINFAIRSDQALANLRALAGRCECLVVEAPRGALVFLNDKHVGTGPRVIMPSGTGEYDVMVTLGGKIWRQRIRFPETRKLRLGGNK